MITRWKWIKNKKYYLYDTYRSWGDALHMAKYQKKRNNSRYFIEKIEIGLLFPEIRYALYLNRVIKLRFI